VGSVHVDEGEVIQYALVYGLCGVTCSSGVGRVVLHSFTCPFAALMAHVQADNAPIDESLFF
jgi:hypothetical protein